MSDLIAPIVEALPLPVVPVAVRAGVMSDLPFIDALQKQHARAVGWMPTKSLEGKIALGQVIVAEESGQWAVGSGQSNPEQNAASSSLPTTHCSPPTPLGYCIAADRYFKRDDVGIVYQMNVVPGRQRSLIGATLLKAQFERSAYGCRLYCCWCAQDLAANRFWEAMGFVPLAFRTGSPTKGKRGSPRVHIFWQKRIRSGDTGDVRNGGTPWWFPSQTSGGSIREDRLVLPIPPGTHWSDAKPIVLPEVRDEGGGMREETRKGLPGPRAKSSSSLLPPPSSPSTPGGLFFAAPPAASPAKEKPTRSPRPKVKNDPTLVAAARELRDRWLERVNEEGVALASGKYDVSRVIEGGRVSVRQVEARALPFTDSRLLPAA